MEHQEKTYELVLRDIEDKLKSGELKLGDRLEGERTLAEKYGISRASVRDAIRVLSVLGVVRSATGSGPGAGTQIIAEPSAGLSAALRLHMASSSLPAEDIIVTRMLLEGWGAAEGAQRVKDRQADEETLAKAQELLNAMDDPGIEPEEFHLLDAQFHVALTSLSANIVIESMMTSLREAVRGYVMDAVNKMDHWEDVADTLRCQHHQIFESISRGESEESRKLVEDHIHWFDTVRRGL